jgi:hypothetical protein
MQTTFMHTSHCRMWQLERALDSDTRSFNAPQPSVAALLLSAHAAGNDIACTSALLCWPAAEVTASAAAVVQDGVCMEGTRTRASQVAGGGWAAAQAAQSLCCLAAQLHTAHSNTLREL